MKLKQCNNISDLRMLAKRKLPSPMFHYIDGGADDEITLRRNTDAFDGYELLANSLIDVGQIDTKTQLLGADCRLAGNFVSHWYDAFISSSCRAGCRSCSRE